MKCFLKEISIFFITILICSISLAQELVLPQSSGDYNKNFFNYSLIGDNINTEVYFFRKDTLLKEKILDATELNNFIEEQEKIFKNLEESKPHVATISENELAHILKSLCQASKNCQEITLYQKNGVGIATSGFKENIMTLRESNNYIKMGMLGYDPEKMIGINKFISLDKITYFEIIKAIYYNKENDNAYLTLERPRENHSLMGYVRHIITIN